MTTHDSFSPFAGDGGLTVMLNLTGMLCEPLLIVCTAKRDGVARRYYDEARAAAEIIIRMAGSPTVKEPGWQAPLGQRSPRGMMAIRRRCGDDALVHYAKIALERMRQDDQWLKQWTSPSEIRAAVNHQLRRLRRVHDRHAETIAWCVERDMPGRRRTLGRTRWADFQSRWNQHKRDGDYPWPTWPLPTPRSALKPKKLKKRRKRR